MGASTEISWTDATWNPVRGCSRVSKGCDNCYAMHFAHRFDTPSEKSPYHGLTTIRRGKVDWTGVARFIPDMLATPLRWRKPRRVFVNSMSDLFHPSLSFDHIDRVFGAMWATLYIGPGEGFAGHTYQILTKQPARAAEYFAADRHEKWAYAAVQVGGGRNPDAIWDQTYFRSKEAPHPRIWLGVSVEDQKTADDRVSLLLEHVPAAVHFASYEPALGPVDFWAFLKSEIRDRSLAALGRTVDTPGLDWVIVGGESGNGARPFDVQWAHNTVRQCASAGVACYVKQLGAKPFDSALRDVWANGKHHYTRAPDDSIVLEALQRTDYRVTPHDVGRLLKSRKGGDMAEWPPELRVREFPAVTR